MRDFERFCLIADHVARIELLVPLGVRLAVLRPLSQSDADVRRQIARARDFCAVHSCQLVVDSHWHAALDLRCRFVHLRGSAIEAADMGAVKRAGLRFGLSPRDPQELEAALGLAPDYIAFEPQSSSNQASSNHASSNHASSNPAIPSQAPKAAQPRPDARDPAAQITFWKQQAGETPLIASGVQAADRLPGLFAAGADCAAMVTSPCAPPNAEAQTQIWMKTCETRAQLH